MAVDAYEDVVARRSERGVEAVRRAARGVLDEGDAIVGVCELARDVPRSVVARPDGEDDLERAVVFLREDGAHRLGEVLLLVEDRHEDGDAATFPVVGSGRLCGGRMLI